MRVHPPPACVAEMKRFWNEEVWDKPFSHRVPVKGFSRLDVQAMEHLGMAVTPPVESSVANHLNLSRRAALSPQSPPAMPVHALNAMSLLTAYQAELLEEMGHQLDSGWTLGGDMRHCRFKPAHLLQSSSKLRSEYGLSGCGREIAMAGFVRPL